LCDHSTVSPTLLQNPEKRWNFDSCLRLLALNQGFRILALQNEFASCFVIKDLSLQSRQKPREERQEQEPRREKRGQRLFRANALENASDASRVPFFAEKVPVRRSQEPRELRRPTRQVSQAARQRRACRASPTSEAVSSKARPRRQAGHVVHASWGTEAG
jgi:hypothetical protein